MDRDKWCIRNYLQLKVSNFSNKNFILFIRIYHHSHYLCVYAAQKYGISNTMSTTNLGATDPRLHSDSRNGRTAGLRAAIRITVSAIAQLLSCSSRNISDTSPNAIVLLIAVIAGSRKGSSISRRNRSLCLFSWEYAKWKFISHVREATRQPRETVYSLSITSQHMSNLIVCQHVIHVSR